MLKTVLHTLGWTLAAMAAASPAFATTAPVPVPEPTTMSIVAVSTAGVALAYRLFRR